MENEYILLGLNGSTKMVYYLSSGSRDKVERAKKVLQDSIILDTLQIAELGDTDNIVELKEDSNKLYNRFKYLLDEVVSQEDEEDDLLG